MYINILLKSILCSFFILTVSIARAEIYQTVDESGNVTYTDVPSQPNSKPIEVPPVNVVPAEERQVSTPAKNPKDEKTEYTELAVIAPQQDATHFINVEPLTIRVSLKPALDVRNGDNLQILLNEEVVAENQQEYQTNSLDRGSYIISARVVDAKQKVLKVSQPVTVHVKRQFVR